MPGWRNRTDNYGWLAIGLHWLVAVGVVGMFGLGLWMRGLNYYDPWYQSAPELHKSLGICLFTLMVLRLVWRWLNPVPRPVAGVSALEARLAGLVHGLLYGLILLVMTSGYLISTADARAIEVFGLLRVPALISGLPNQADIAGLIHLWLAIGLVSLAGLHALAALKHHFLDRDRTLLRMLGRDPTQP